MDRIEGRVYFGNNPVCANDTLLWRHLARQNHERFGVSVTFDCAFISPNVLPAGAALNDAPPLAALAAAGGGRADWLPPLWLAAGYAKTVGANEVLLALYRFDPRLFTPGAVVGGGFWAPGRMSEGQQALLGRLIRWALASSPAVHRGMGGDGSVGPLGTP